MVKFNFSPRRCKNTHVSTNKDLKIDSVLADILTSFVKIHGLVKVKTSIPTSLKSLSEINNAK